MHGGREAQVLDLLVGQAQLLGEDARVLGHATDVLVGLPALVLGYLANDTIEATVASSLLNAILENNKDIKNDEGRVLDDRNPSAYGLTDVVIIDGSATHA